jgi:hypothetical protein
MNPNLEKLLNLGTECSIDAFNAVWESVEQDTSIPENLKTSIRSNINTTPNKLIAAIDYAALTK